MRTPSNSSKRPGRKLVAAAAGVLLPSATAALFLSMSSAHADPVDPLHHVYVKVGAKTKSVYIETDVPVIGVGPTFTACRRVTPGGGYQDGHQDLYSNARTTIIALDSQDCSFGATQTRKFTTSTNPGDIYLDLSKDPAPTPPTDSSTDRPGTADGADGGAGDADAGAGAGDAGAGAGAGDAGAGAGDAGAGSPG